MAVVNSGASENGLFCYADNTRYQQSQVASGELDAETADETLSPPFQRDVNPGLLFGAGVELCCSA
jgi:hypothetical protein